MASDRVDGYSYHQRYAIPKSTSTITVAPCGADCSLQIPEIFSDDGTMAPNSAFKECCDLFFEIGNKMGTDLYSPRYWKTQLEEAGFQNVEELSLKMPSGPWVKNRRLREVGMCERQVRLGPPLFLPSHYALYLISCNLKLTI